MDIKREDYLVENEEALNRVREGFDDKKVPEDILAKKAAFTEDGKPIGEAGQGGSTVVANPELEGTEPNLTGLEVEGIKYKVPVPPTPATTKLYTHMYGVKGNDRNMVFTLLRSDDTELTVQEVIDRLESLGCAYSVGDKANSIMYPASGVDYSGKEIIGVSVNEEYGQKQLVFIDNDFSPSTTLSSALPFDIHVVAQL